MTATSRGLTAALLLTAGLAGCAAPDSGEQPPAGRSAPGAAQDGVYAAAVAHFLSSDGNSYGRHRFPRAFVLDHLSRGAADPLGPSTPATGEPIAAEERNRIVAAVGPDVDVEFVPSRRDAMATAEECASIRDGGIYIAVEPATSTAGDRAEVGIHGFVACDGAEWLTYVLRRQDGQWTVTGTTGTMSIA